MRSLISLFFLELIGKIGPAMLAGTLVGCILAGRFEWIHFVLVVISLSCISTHFIITHRAEVRRAIDPSNN